VIALDDDRVLAFGNQNAIPSCLDHHNSPAMVIGGHGAPGVKV
jgi:hypothetical protein